MLISRAMVPCACAAVVGLMGTAAGCGDSEPPPNGTGGGTGTGASGGTGAVGAGASGGTGATGSGAAAAGGAGATGGGGTGGKGGGGGTGGMGGGVACVDVSGFGWSAQALVEAPNVSDAEEVAVGLDASGRAFALLQGGVGAALNLRRTTYDPAVGWATAIPVGNSPIAISWSPRVLVNGAGDVVASYSDFGKFVNWGQFDTTGGVGPGGQNVNTGSPFGGSIAISELGTTLVTYTQVVGSFSDGFVSVDYAPGTAVFDAAQSVVAGTASLDPDGDGAVFGTGTDGTSFVAVPYTAASGFGAQEPVHDGSFSATTGGSGVSLQGKTMLAMLGSIPVSSVQIFATYRDVGGSWTTPARFDTGDGSGHAQLHALESRAPDTAFTLWHQPDGFYVGRFAGSATVSDVLALGPSLPSWSLAPAACGNAVIAFRTGLDQDVHVRYFVAGTGWLAEQTLGGGFGGGDLSVALGPAGEGMLVSVVSDQFNYSTFGP